MAIVVVLCLQKANQLNDKQFKMYNMLEFPSQPPITQSKTIRNYKLLLLKLLNIFVIH